MFNIIESLELLNPNVLSTHRYCPAPNRSVAVVPWWRHKCNSTFARDTSHYAESDSWRSKKLLSPCSGNKAASFESTLSVWLQGMMIGVNEIKMCVVLSCRSLGDWTSTKTWFWTFEISWNQQDSGLWRRWWKRLEFKGFPTEAEFFEQKPNIIPREQLLQTSDTQLYLSSVQTNVIPSNSIKCLFKQNRKRFEPWWC